MNLGSDSNRVADLVRKGLAGGSNSVNQLLDHIGPNSSRYPRLTMAKNPARPMSIRESLKEDSDPYVRLAAGEDWSWMNQVWPKSGRELELGDLSHAKY